MAQMTTNANLTWLLDDFVARIDQVEHAIVLSVDGLLTAASGALNRDDAEQLGAIASGIQSLARAAGKRFNGGPLQHTIVEMKQAALLVTAAGDGSCLAVLASENGDLGVIAYEMAMLVVRVGKFLDTPPRSDELAGGA
ncbi:roadblock/LC7 domain-containing protein [Dactylosporangium darangshiense]|uniref:Roadblock/LC7 domain-containing protein n=1 Tax=Dactylosporangium darangshiense TaxID=579108 RepID=A0ABP8D2T0_9ACTN